MINNELFNYFYERYQIALTENEIKEIVKISAKSNLSGKVSMEMIKDIFDFYNKNRNRMPEAQLLTDTRERNIRSRIQKFGIDKVKEVILLSSKSDYMNGKIINWRASLDWIIKPANFVKIMEGNYKNKSNEQSGQTQQPGRNR